MARFLHSVVVPEQAIAADGIFTYDLGVNPLSMLLITLKPLNDTGTLANFCSYLSVCDAVNKLTIYNRGESVVSMKGVDIAALNYFRHGIIPPQANHVDTNNDKRSVVLPVLLGKNPFDSQSCFPAAPRGSLSLELDLDIADTGYDTLRLQVDAIELLDAKPREYERKIQIAQTFSATGDQSVELTPGFKNRGILLWGTTGYAGGSPAPSWGRVKLLYDNQEFAFNAVDFETAHMLGSLWGRQPPMMDSHKHRVTTDGNAQTELATLAGPYDVGKLWTLYGFLDLDPTRDDMFTADFTKAMRVQLLANAETSDAVRCVCCDVVPV